MRIRFACFALVATGVLVAGAAWSQTLYKLVDKNGKVTYSETVPKGFDGQVTRMDIDPKANTATLPKPSKSSSSGEGGSQGKSAEEDVRESTTRRESAEAKLEEARSRLEEARAALKDARDNPREGDLQWIANVGGGTRSVPSDDYRMRLEKLEANLAKAEEDLKRLERGS